MTTLKLEIVTAESSVFSDEIDAVTAPGIVGQLTILPHHAPLMTVLEQGELRLRKGSEEIFLVISGGFLEVLDNRVVILADTAERPEEIDVERAEAAKRRAEERISEHRGELDLLRAEASLKRSLARLKVAQQRRRRERKSGMK
ncbi:MAG: F0F1 ATP synthase subunit epsilon [Chloroflexi bacterium]|nr:F0F1 ATP synthase subunit epsilon [Chloroflexota bacterium]